MHACIFLGYVHFMALAMVPAGSSRPIEKIVPGPLCFDAHFGAPLPPAPGAAAPPPPPPRYATGFRQHFDGLLSFQCALNFTKVVILILYRRRRTKDL
jgi:hypothetical protein